MSRGLGYITGLNEDQIAFMRNQIRDWEARTGLPFFDMDKIKETLGSLVEQGYGGVYGLYGRVDIREHMSVDPNPDKETFNCLFMQGHIGWFYTHEGISRYYSKMRHQEDVVVYTFDITDLLLVALSKDSKAEVYSYLREEFPYAESENQEAERIRYNRNRTFLMNYTQIEQDLLSDDDVSILFALMHISEDNFYDTMKKIENKTFFFASLKFIQNHLKERGVKISQTALSNRINRLATLGFIRKVGRREENEKYYKASIKRYLQDKEASKLQYNVITYYQIETFTERLKTAEKHDKKLKQKGIRVDQITEAEIVYFFGSTWAKRVFPVKTYKRKHKYAKEKKAYTEAFFVLLKKQGYVLKEQLSHLAHKKLADRLWTMLANRVTGIKKRLSKKIKDFLNIEGTGAIVMSYSLFHSLFTVIEKSYKKGAMDDEYYYEQEKARIITFFEQPIIRWLRINREPDRTDAVF